MLTHRLLQTKLVKFCEDAIRQQLPLSYLKCRKKAYQRQDKTRYCHCSVPQGSHPNLTRSENSHGRLIAGDDLLKA
eukprot:2232919-Pleurochrysis_carterae.AAC.4